MKIQVISYDKKIRYGKEHDFTYSSLSEPFAFDSFDLNIISLQTPEVWTNKEKNTRSIDLIKDLYSLKQLINRTIKSKILICLPQNYLFKYYLIMDDYNREENLKNIIPDFTNIIKELTPQNVSFSLIYENSTTSCGIMNYFSAFYFTDITYGGTALTKTKDGNHTTSISINQKLIITTLDISSTNSKLNYLLKAVGVIVEESEMPLWINDLDFFDDADQKKIVSDANAEIERQKAIVNSANIKLKENQRYKSILYETGKPLVKVVFDIFEKILSCDLSSFIDENKEDFRVVLSDVTFIGEIKGITSNVKSENVSQLEVHCQTYIDSLDEIGNVENVKGLLIINPLRNKPTIERDEVNEKQIQLATHYGSLIITTETLLSLFAAYLQGQITNDRVIELFKNKIGLLTNSDFILPKE